MTPIKCFRVKGLEIWVEDWAGNRDLFATCPSEREHLWLLSSLEAFHRVKVLEWNVEYKP